MAAMPPPYSPREAGRQARAAARMQRAQYRAQASFARRRPSFVGPLLLITTGVVALLLETGKIQAYNFWPWYAHWWPAVLVLIGLGLLAEYFVDRNNPAAGRRSVGGIVWLIVLLSIVGAASHTLNDVAPWGDHFSDAFGGRGGWLSMMGEEHSDDVTLSEPIAASGTLSIDNARGDVTVSTDSDGVGNSGRGEVRVEAHQVVHANSDSGARSDFEATRPAIVAHGADATLTVPSRNGASVDLKVVVPAGVALLVRTTHGDVTVSGLKRTLAVNASHGDVTVDSIGGAVHLQMDKGDIIAHDLAGDLTIDGRADDVTVSGVKGRSLLNGDFFGDTRVESDGTPLHFHSSRTDLDIPRLHGEMTMDSGDLRVSGPSGGVRLSTRSKDIEMTGLVGDAHIENSNGDVSVTAGMPLGNLQLSDHTGSLTLSVPANAAFSVRASVDDSDELNTDFPLTTENGPGRKTLNGQVGQGGPHLELQTGHGDLALRRVAPQSGSSGLGVPEINIPAITVPGMTVPGVKAPAIHIPAIHVPAVPAAPTAPPPPRHLHSRAGDPQPSAQ